MATEPRDRESVRADIQILSTLSDRQIAAAAVVTLWDLVDAVEKVAFELRTARLARTEQP